MATPMNGGITRDHVRAALAFGGLHGAGASFNRDQIRAMAREIDTLDDLEARLKRVEDERDALRAELLGQRERTKRVFEILRRAKRDPRARVAEALAALAAVLGAALDGRSVRRG